MARQKRTDHFTPTVGRTLERIAIAILAAFAARDQSTSFAVSAVAIFAIVAVIEELGRGFIWHGRRVTLRDLAYKYALYGRVQHGEPWRSNKPRRKRTRTRRRASEAIDHQADSGTR
jgi:hypothetical protein